MYMKYISYIPTHSNLIPLSSSHCRYVELSSVFNIPTHLSGLSPVRLTLKLAVPGRGCCHSSPRKLLQPIDKVLRPLGGEPTHTQTPKGQKLLA